MSGVLVDSNVILDLVTDDPRWAEWSEQLLERYAGRGSLFINDLISTEVSIGLLQYRRAGGVRASPLPDFFIGAHAAVSDLPLLTRNNARYQTYFPTIELITPAN
jgi:hypothetical protein